MKEHFRGNLKWVQTENLEQIFDILDLTSIERDVVLATAVRPDFKTKF